MRCSVGCGALCPTARVSWFRDDDEVSRSSMNEVWQGGPLSRRFSDLRISSANEANTGEYRCRASISEDETTSTPFSINLMT